MTPWMEISPRSGAPSAIAVMLLPLVFSLAAWTTPAHALLSSYPLLATDVSGQTGSSTVAVGVPDYQFVNDSGLGFGGTNTDVFEAGESTVLAFPAGLRNVPAQTDLIVYAYVGGLGATDNATVQVEASSDGTNFVVVGTFNTDEARNRPQDVWENGFAAVKKFFVEFGTADNVTHIRLTNLASTIEGLRLDAVEGLHPDTVSTHAFEMRLQRSREDSWQQFRIRIKNLGDPNGAPIREIRIINSLDPLAKLEQTDLLIEGVDGDFICIENCIPICTVNCGTPPPRIPFARYVWSVDATIEAPPGLGLDPGKTAAHFPAFGVDTDSIAPYLSGYSFEVTFADGVVHTFDYDADFEKRIGSLYEKYLYFSTTPALSWSRPVDYFEFVEAAPPAPSVPLFRTPVVFLFVVMIAGLGSALVGTRRSGRQVDPEP